MDLTEKHQKLLYPVVRIFAIDAQGRQSAGSGTILYSEPDPENDGEYLNFVLTNHHVIDSLILLKESWDSVMKKNRKKEFFTKAKVEVFEYIRQSVMDSSNRFVADVVAYSVSHDLALLKVSTPRKFEFVAPIFPKDKINDLRLFCDIAVSGCSMAHEPFCNFGQLTFLSEDIENKQYFMYNAGSYFGNSGGALFWGDENVLPEYFGHLIGVPSRLTGIQLGFGFDMVTFMGFAAHTSRLYEFLSDQHMDFIVDKDKTWYDAVDERKQSEKKSTLELALEAEKSCGGCK